MTIPMTEPNLIFWLAVFAVMLSCAVYEWHKTEHERKRQAAYKRAIRRSYIK